MPIAAFAVLLLASFAAFVFGFKSAKTPSQVRIAFLAGVFCAGSAAWVEDHFLHWL